MIDIKFLRENPDIVKQNIKNKFQDHKHRDFFPGIFRYR